MAYPIPSPYMEPPHEPQPDLFDIPPVGCIDNPYAEFRDGEVRGLNADWRREQRFREAEYNESF